MTRGAFQLFYRSDIFMQAAAAAPEAETETEADLFTALSPRKKLRRSKAQRMNMDYLPAIGKLCVS